MEGKPQSPALVMRVMKIVFIVSGVLFFFVALKLPNNTSQPPMPKIQLLLTVLALSNVVFGFNTRRIIRGAKGTSEDVPTSIQLKRWMSAGVVSLAFFESCILFGFVLHFLGAPFWRVELLFGVGLIAMLFWSPGTPPGTEGNSLQG